MLGRSSLGSTNETKHNDRTARDMPSSPRKVWSGPTSRVGKACKGNTIIKAGMRPMIEQLTCHVGRVVVVLQHILVVEALFPARICMTTCNMPRAGTTDFWCGVALNLQKPCYTMPAEAWTCLD